MHQIALFASPSAPIDTEVLRETLGTDARIDVAPHEYLKKPLDQQSEQHLCSFVANASAIFFRVGQVTRRIIEAAKSLRIVAVHGIGTDSVDLDAATRRGVFVTITPHTNTRAVAEYVMCSMLLFCRRLHEAVETLRAGNWEEARIEGVELAGKSLGVIGFGAVGSYVAQLAEALGMQVLVAGHLRLPPQKFRVLPLRELAAAVDFLVVAVPRRKDTEGLISEEILRRMRSTAVLINVSRGGIVDEDALIAALDRGGLAAAWVDVFRAEPVPPSHRLILHPKVFPTPHIAGSTRESLARTARVAGEDIRRVLDNRLPVHAVNPEAATATGWSTGAVQ